MTKTLIVQEAIAEKIFFLRGRKVMLDRDLSDLYGAATKRLNEQVKRNIHRFPDDFMFRLTKQEKEELVANCDRLSGLKHSSSLPYAFTEPGVAMLSSVLNSETAIMVNIQIIRTFIRLREMMAGYQELRDKIEDLELKYDQQFRAVFEAIKQLIAEEEPRVSIGFHNR